MALQPEFSTLIFHCLFLLTERLSGSQDQSTGGLQVTWHFCSVVSAVLFVDEDIVSVLAFFSLIFVKSVNVWTVSDWDFMFDFRSSHQKGDSPRLPKPAPSSNGIKVMGENIIIKGILVQWLWLETPYEADTRTLRQPSTSLFISFRQLLGIHS